MIGQAKWRVVVLLGVGRVAAKLDGIPAADWHFVPSLDQEIKWLRGAELRRDAGIDIHGYFHQEKDRHQKEGNRSSASALESASLLATAQAVRKEHATYDDVCLLIAAARDRPRIISMRALGEEELPMHSNSTLAQIKYPARTGGLEPHRLHSARTQSFLPSDLLSQPTSTSGGTGTERDLLELDAQICSDVRFVQCKPILRIPLQETWMRWMDFERAVNGSGDGKMFWSINEADLIKNLLAKDRTPFDRMGRRRAYLQFDLPTDLQGLLNTQTTFDLCLRTSNTHKPIKVATINQVPAPEVRTSFAIVPTSMRVFFDPGWRLTKSIYGNNLMMSDKISLKLEGCRGKIDEMSMYISSAVKWTQDLGQINRPTSLRAHLEALSHSAINFFISAAVPFRERLDFDIKYDGVTNGDLTIDWRKAALFLRKIQSQKTDSNAARRANQKRSLQDESLRMALCYYSDYSDPNGAPIGTAQFQLATTDAAEFVAVSIFILLGLPVCCMWSIGCLGLKHKRLRNELRRLRLSQQRDEIEHRLADYLGYTSAPFGKDDDEEESEASPLKELN